MNFLNQNYDTVKDTLKRTFTIPLLETLSVLAIIILFLSHNKFIFTFYQIISKNIQQIPFFSKIIQFELGKIVAILIMILIFGSFIQDWLFYIGIKSPFMFFTIPSTIFINNLDIDKYKNLRKIFKTRMNFDNITNIDRIIDGFIDKSDESKSSTLVKGCKRCKEKINKINKRIYYIKGLFIVLSVISIVNYIMGYKNLTGLKTEISILFSLIIIILNSVSSFLNTYSLYTGQKIDCYILEKLDNDILQQDAIDKNIIEREFNILNSANEQLDKKVISFSVKQPVENSINLAIEIRKSIKSSIRDMCKTIKSYFS